MKCHECKFFHCQTVDAGRMPIYECRIRAPIGTWWHDELYGMFPQIDPNAWCGEFVAAPHDHTTEQAESGKGE